MTEYKHTINGVEHILVFNPDAKGSQPRYTIDGKRATGVTTILGMIAKPQLVDWAVRLNAREAVLQSANGVGYPQELINKLIKFDKITSAQSKKLALKFPEWQDAITAHTKKSDAAKDIGTLAHSNVEEYIRYRMGETTSFAVNPEVAYMVQPFVDWAEGKVKVTPQAMRTAYNHNVVEIAPEFTSNIERPSVTFLRAEQSTFSPKLFVAGTFDFLAVVNGKKYMCDFKTSGGIYGREYFYQTAAYRSFCEEMGWGKDIEGSIIVRCGKERFNEDGELITTPDLEVKVSHDYKADYGGFLAAYVLYHKGQVSQEVTDELTKVAVELL